MPTRPITPELDALDEFKKTNDYSVLLNFITHLKSHEFVIDEITDGVVYPKNHRLVLGEHPKGYKADIYVEDRSVDEIISIHKGFDWSKIKEQQAMMFEYNEDVRTKLQKFETSAQ